MESKILYQLTMRGNPKQCELDLALYEIQDSCMFNTLMSHCW